MIQRKEKGQQFNNSTTTTTTKDVASHDSWHPVETVLTCVLVLYCIDVNPGHRVINQSDVEDSDLSLVSGFAMNKFGFGTTPYTLALCLAFPPPYAEGG